ncbi:MAG TPA: hypothetical protein VMB51_04070 [Solirubrobacteraceae bacterium]|nr:hypothetical protein [Solirubrobacteraceae bacterium]
MTTLAIDAGTYSQLRGALRWTGVEQVTFLFTGPPGRSGPLVVEDIYPVPPEGFDFQSDLHVSLTDQTRAYVIKHAWDLGGALVETHSHKHGPPGFSPSDLYGFSDWVPHVRWRLASRPYIALVFVGGTFDALVWEGTGDSPSPLHALIVNRKLQLPSGITYKQLAGAR